MALEMTDRQRRWLNALLILGTLTVALVFVGLVADILVFFSDVLLIFFLAWLLAFVLSPIVTAMERALPMLPRSVAVAVTYATLLVVLLILTILVAQSLATSIGNFVESIPQLQQRLPEILEPWQARLRELGLQIDLVAAAQSGLSGLGTLGGDLVRPLSELALASLGIFGNLLLILFLSLFMVVDRDRLTAFLVRLVPARYTEEARLFETSVASSFGGFLRGQAIMGLIYGLVAAVTHLLLGLPYGGASAATAGLLQAIPFFGPFFSWAPPVLVAILTKPEATLPALALMAAGWFVVMNVVQPRLMATAVGIHPVVVLGSVIVGLKVAGIAGAVFGIPIAAVVSSFFFYYLNRSATLSRDVTSRAARLLEQREGRRVRIPTPPPLPAEPGQRPLGSPDLAPATGSQRASVATEVHPDPAAEPPRA
ncbi:MAG TPA: AI-2E family transporter [Candidatus Limnocylindrales bacterium]|jgi:predicted PurR-regulated permease PerM|nr:AI-2E family transporter [Candidatus Limnocylindrales bacterium]